MNCGEDGTTVDQSVARGPEPNDDPTNQSWGYMAEPCKYPAYCSPKAALIDTNDGI